MELIDFDHAAFLRDHWQRAPLLIRNPWASWTNPLEPDELAGLSCENDIESRLVTRSGTGWDLEHGPFPESRFSQMDEEAWTLLVQAVDHHIPTVAALLEPFRFIPNWRIDDVMVSYAVDGGGVGPHYDQYDVFLIQGLGKRRWQLGGMCDGATKMLPHEGLRLLADFQPTEEWVLEPGDILYVPPGIAHNGTAVGDDCMTYSIGFRAPSRAELIGGWAESVIAHLDDDDDRYTDPDLQPQENPGEISASAIARLHEMIRERAQDRRIFARSFGEYSTAPKDPDVDWRPDQPVNAADVRLHMAEGAALIRNPASRFSYVREGSSSVLFFADGRCFPCTGGVAEFAEEICARHGLMPAPDQSDFQQTVDLIVELFNQGSITFDLRD
ncbi:JmjC domain-containing protein [Pacificimonas sp. ICDLI1SI03]